MTFSSIPLALMFARRLTRLLRDSLTEEPTVMVGHSLGSVVAYSVLRSDRRSLRVPLYLTWAVHLEYVPSATNFGRYNIPCR